jgi:hypothetical protein
MLLPDPEDELLPESQYKNSDDEHDEGRNTYDD